MEERSTLNEQHREQKLLPQLLQLLWNRKSKRAKNRPGEKIKSVIVQLN